MRMLQIFIGTMVLLCSIQLRADAKLWDGKSKYRSTPSWKAETVKVQKTEFGLKVSFTGDTWNGVLLHSWGVIEYSAAIRVTFSTADPAELKKLIFRGKFSDTDSASKDGPVIKLTEYTFNKNKRGQFVVDIPIDKCDPEVHKNIVGVMLSSLEPLEFTVVSIDTIDAVE